MIDTRPGLRAWLEEAAARRDERQLTRRLVARPAEAADIDLAGNDYLGLLRHPVVVE